MGVINKSIMVAVSLLVVSLVLPIALIYISNAGNSSVTINGTAQTLASVADPAVVTLLTVLLPILAVIGIIMYYLPRKS